jgi:hypothetical protein
VLPRKEVGIVLTEEKAVSKGVVPKPVESKILVRNEDLAVVMHLAPQARGVIETRFLIDPEVVTGPKVLGEMNPLPESEVLDKVVSKAVIKNRVRLAGDLPD